MEIPVICVHFFLLITLHYVTGNTTTKLPKTTLSAPDNSTSLSTTNSAIFFDFPTANTTLSSILLIPQGRSFETPLTNDTVFTITQIDQSASTTVAPDSGELSDERKQEIKEEFDKEQEYRRQLIKDGMEQEKAKKLKEKQEQDAKNANQLPASTIPAMLPFLPVGPSGPIMAAASQQQPYAGINSALNQQLPPLTANMGMPGLMAGYGQQQLPLGPSTMQQGQGQSGIPPRQIDINSMINTPAMNPMLQPKIMDAPGRFNNQLIPSTMQQPQQTSTQFQPQQQPASFGQFPSVQPSQFLSQPVQQQQPTSSIPQSSQFTPQQLQQQRLQPASNFPQQQQLQPNFPSQQPPQQQSFLPNANTGMFPVQPTSGFTGLISPNSGFLNNQQLQPQPQQQVQQPVGGGVPALTPVQAPRSSFPSPLEYNMMPSSMLNPPGLMGSTNGFFPQSQPQSLQQPFNG